MSSSIFLSSDVVIFIFLESILFFLLTLSLYFVILILKNWDFKSTTALQYGLEKKSYLVTLIIYFTIALKLLLLPYFVYSIDILSNIVPGAMCGAGVISANEYGESLLILKTFILFFTSLWLVINQEDIKEKEFPYIKKKFFYFIFIFILITLEFYLNIKYFSNISTDSIVTCCSAIYSSVGDTNPLPLSMNLQALLISFYFIYILSFISNLKKLFIVSAVLSSTFLYISYYALLYFFGTYIYELPTHHCPFCMLQKDYFYIGYLIFISLFLGTFYGIVNLGLKLIIKKEITKYYIYSNIFNTIFIFICTFYVLNYYIKNGVLL